MNFYAGLHPDKDFKLNEIRTYSDHDKAAVYLLILQNRDYLLISAEYAAKPILGYGSGAQLSESIPVNMQSWINTLSAQIGEIRKNKIKPTPAIKREWQQLKTGARRPERKGEAVEPLLMCTWHQDHFYNEMCPELPDKPGQHALTGCVATAMGQTMYYFRYPPVGDSSKSYYSGMFDTISANFGESAYRWNEMVPQIHNTSIPAIATLLFHAGVSVETGYSYGGSGAYTKDAANALKTYFRYADTIQYAMRDTTANAEWMDMLLNNIYDQRPVIYHGSSGFSGHCFVVDGYDGNGFFHLNWGWEGWWNGYYTIDYLNPGGYHFDTQQGAVFNIMPENDYPPYCNAQVDTLDFFTGTITDGSGPENYLNNAEGKWLIAPEDNAIQQMQITFERLRLADESDSLILYDGPDPSYPILAAFSGIDSTYAVTSTQDQVFVHFKTNGEGTDLGWHLTYYAFDEGFCNGLQTITKESFYINDKSGPYNYLNNSDCKWLIAPESEQTDTIGKITLNFVEIDLEEGKDFLTIYKGPTTDYPVAYQFTGNIDPDTVDIEESQVLLHFTSDEQYTRDGFTLTYDISSYRYCQGTVTLNNPSGTFSDGSGTNDYQSDTDCSWYINPENADTVVLHFTKFDMEPGYDHVRIYDPEPVPDYLIAQYSGHVLPADVKSPSGRMLVQFHSDFVTNFDGFEAEYWSITVGIDEKRKTRLQAYPNPCRNQFKVSLPEREEFVSAGIYGASGREITLMPVYKDQGELHFSTLPLEQGIYFLHLQGENQSYYTKIIVQHD
ncbi:MAG: C10 family peptidase [Bacteroidales bacterium]|nr:C10 family peptidase [Bacteroidales bacterium]